MHFVLHHGDAVFQTRFDHLRKLRNAQRVSGSTQRKEFKDTSLRELVGFKWQGPAALQYKEGQQTNSPNLYEF